MLAQAKRVVAPIVGVLVAVGLWEFIATASWIDASSLPPFHKALQTTGKLVTSDSFQELGLKTIAAWGVGLGVSVLIALPLGLLLGLNRRITMFARIPLETLRPIPPIIILPLALLTLGGGGLYQTVLIAQGAMWSLLITISYSVQDVDRVMLETAASYRLGRIRTLVLVRIPQALPQMLTGLRTAAGTAFAVTLVSEMLGGASGIGTRLMTAQSGANYAVVYAVTLVAGVIGVLISVVFGLLERPFKNWRPS